MEIIIKEIPEEGMQLHLDSKKDGWFRQAISDSLSDLYKTGDKGEGEFELLRIGVNVDCSGVVDCDCHPTCCRCLKVFPSHMEVPIHLTLAPLYESERQLKLEQKDEVALVKDDLEFSYYEGDDFNLGGIIREQVILALPLQTLCKKNCKGLCQRCGKDLNEGPCDCKQEQADPRWRPLKAFKAKR